jgi:hypothetical protein
MGEGDAMVSVGKKVTPLLSFEIKEPGDTINLAFEINQNPTPIPSPLLLHHVVCVKVRSRRLIQSDYSNGLPLISSRRKPDTPALGFSLVNELTKT